MSNSIRVFMSMIVLYVGTIAVALCAAWKHIVTPGLGGGLGALELSMQSAFIFIAVFAVFTYVMVRFARVARYSLAFFLMVALIAGAQFVFAAITPMPYSLLAGVLIAFLAWRVPLVIIHNIAIIFGIGGISGIIGLSLTPLIASAFLALLSIYDIYSVYRSRHMVVMAGRMMQSGAVFGFLVPARIRTFFKKRSVAIQERNVMVLGSGDIGIPLILAVSALSQSVGAALMISGFSLVGVSVMHWLFSRQERTAPMAALPPIAVSAILGYALAISLGI